MHGRWQLRGTQFRRAIIDLVRRFDELSEERVELNFGRALRVALDDRSAVVRQLAVAGLWEDESSELLDRLRDMLVNDESPDVRAQAAAALERFSSMAAVGSLDEPVANDLRHVLRQSAIDADAPYAVQRRALESLGPYAADPQISSSSPRRSILTTTACSAAPCMPWVGARTRAGCR